MTSPRTITAEVPAYLWSEFYGPQDLQQSAAEVVSVLSLRDMRANQKYVLVGTANVTVELLDEDSIVANKIEALRAQKTQTLADAQAKATQIERQINELLALTNEVSA